MTDRRRDEKRVRAALRELEAPDEHMAEERGRQVVQAAFAEREPGPAPSRTRRRAALALLAGAAVAGFAMTPAGADVREWLAERVDPGEEKAEPRLTSLPTPGSVLVEAPSGAWVINEDGSKRRLGDYDLATWSPNGRFVGVAKGSELRAIDPSGNFRWSIESPEEIEAIDWSADEGFRVAYLARDQIRVVAGDGTDDRFLLGPARSVRPIWRPEDDPGLAVHELTYVDSKNRVVLINVDSEKILWRTAPFATPVSELEWSSDGETLMIEATGPVSLFDADGRPVLKGSITSGKSYRPAQLSPSGDQIALLRDSGAGEELVLVTPQTGRERTLYKTNTRARGTEFSEPILSPDGEWILLPWRAADQWLFIRIEDRRVTAVADIARQFESPDRRNSFPRVAGWCCAP